MLRILSILKNQKKAAISLLVLMLSLNVSAQCSTTGWKKFSQGERFSVAIKEVVERLKKIYQLVEQCLPKQDN